MSENPRCLNCGYPTSATCPVCGRNDLPYQITGPGRQVGAFWCAPAADAEGNPRELAILGETSASDAAIWFGDLRLAQQYPIPHVQQVFDVQRDETGHVWALCEALPSSTLADLIGARGRLSPSAAAYVMLIALDVVEQMDRRTTSAGVIVPEDVTISPERKITLREPLLGHAGDGRISPYRSPDSALSRAGDIYSLGRLLAFMLTGSPQSLPLLDELQDLVQLLRMMCALDASSRPKDLTQLRGIFQILNQGEIPGEKIQQLLSGRIPTAVTTPKPAPAPVPETKSTVEPAPVVAAPPSKPEPTPAPVPTPPPIVSAPPPPVEASKPPPPPTAEKPPKPAPEPKAIKPKPTAGEVTPYREKLFRWIGIYAAILINALILLVFFILILRKVL
jgi:serine/threonine protein kinase